MKILHVMPYCPIPTNFGGALRVYHILDNLTRSNDVSVIMYGTPEDEKNMRETFGTKIRNLRVIPRPWRGNVRRLTQIYALCTKQSFFHLLAESRQMQQAIDGMVGQENFDTVLIEFPHMAGFDFATDARKILDAHNIEHEIYRQLWLTSRSPLRKLHYKYEYRNLRRYELDIYKKQDAIFVTSEQDKVAMEQHSPGNSKFVIPNGVDTRYFQNEKESKEPFSLMFSGAIGYRPNYDAVVYFLDEIFPLVLRQIPETKIYIVGNSPPKDLKKRNSGQIIVTDFVPDVRPYFERASVYVVPLRLGSGTRLKILEALSMRKPVVTTSIGCEGLDIVHGETALIADRPDDFAAAVVELLQNSELRKKLSRNGNELVRQRYDWSVIGRSMESCFSKMSGDSVSLQKIRVIEKA